jgi:polar amino acid transport system permease protein
MDEFVATFFDWTLIKEVLPDLVTTGLKNTILLSLGASLLGFLLALPLALMGLSRHRYLVIPARVFTDIFRGLPAILTILLLGQALSPLGLRLFGPSPFPLAIFALGLITAAYTGEIFRAGIQSVEKGQLEASRALGMGYGAAMRLVVIPQGIRRVIPSLVNQFIGVIKDSSLVYTLGLIAGEREIFRVGNDAAVSNANLSPLVAAGLMYLVITVPLTHTVNHIDRRLREGRTPVDRGPAPDEPLSPDGAKALDQEQLVTSDRH